ncbi:tetratricopeptide repeat protein [Dactylosporangium sp. CS-033363]|uniref:tetratricopeptide repeat protein n=1 Tax=Dactylosporangium sp. CS-033363 TaxID=3239935 RepID=UPI003D93ED84
MIAADRGGVAVGSVVYQRRTAAGAPLRLDPRPAQVVGRDELLAEIATRFDGVAGPVPVALCGLGGVGKTTTALEYAYRTLRGYALVWMFHAEDATALLAQFHELAELLDPTGLLEQADPVARVHGALARQPGRWLLIFDNVRDHAAIRTWLPPHGAGDVLVTTQDGHWPALQAVEVGGLSPAVAAQFLLNQAREYDVTSARAIAAQLGELPLALAQAGAFVVSTGRTLAEYLALLEQDRAGLLTRGAPTAHRLPVVATWRLAFDDLAKTSPGSIALLRLLSCLAPEDIPFRLLLAGPLPAAVPGAVRAELEWLQGRFGLDDAVAGLRRNSLIGPPSGVVSVHRLVQAVTLDELHEPRRAAWRAAAAALVQAAVPADVIVRDTWPACLALLPHALLVADLLGDPMRRLALSLEHAGDYSTACRVGQIISDAHHATLGPEHPDTLNARATLANSTGDAGDAAAARDQFAALLPVRERVSGREHSDTLTARANLAFWTGFAGDATAARDRYLALLPVLERVFGTEHADTLTVRGNLAYWTGATGDAVAARDQYAALLPARERVSGPEHPDTLNHRGNLANWTGDAGDAAAARDQFAALLVVRERVSGPEHPDTLAVRANVAHWTGVAGDAAAARDQFAALLPVLERACGPEHPTTRTVRAHLTGPGPDAEGRGA